MYTRRAFHTQDAVGETEQRPWPRAQRERWLLQQLRQSLRRVGLTNRLARGGGEGELTMRCWPWRCETL